jgi:hypothetical protein
MPVGSKSKTDIPSSPAAMAAAQPRGKIFTSQVDNQMSINRTFEVVSDNNTSHLKALLCRLSNHTSEIPMDIGNTLIVAQQRSKLEFQQNRK